MTVDIRVLFVWEITTTQKGYGILSKNGKSEVKKWNAFCQTYQWNKDQTEGYQSSE
jgi:hypothetical protein